jgi:hypothetical protein
MRAICLNCTLKRSPEPSSAASLSEVVMSALRDEGVETDEIRLADHQIDPGVVSEAVTDGDAWPQLRERILVADQRRACRPRLHDPRAGLDVLEQGSGSWRGAARVRQGAARRMNPDRKDDER